MRLTFKDDRAPRDAELLTIEDGVLLLADGERLPLSELAELQHLPR